MRMPIRNNSGLNGSSTTMSLSTARSGSSRTPFILETARSNAINTSFVDWASRGWGSPMVAWCWGSAALD